MIKIRRAAQRQYRTSQHYTPQNAKEKFLVKTLADVTTKQEVAAFLRDLLTMTEIEEFANRLEIARLLFNGHSYQEVADKTNVSTTTVTRVAQWLFNGAGGYLRALQRNKK